MAIEAEVWGALRVSAGALLARSSTRTGVLDLLMRRVASPVEPSEARRLVVIGGDLLRCIDISLVRSSLLGAYRARKEDLLRADLIGVAMLRSEADAKAILSAFAKEGAVGMSLLALRAAFGVLGSDALPESDFQRLRAWMSENPVRW